MSQIISMDNLKRVSAFLTIVMVSPSLYVLLTKRLTPLRMILGMMNCALAFFLASFQVECLAYRYDP